MTTVYNARELLSLVEEWLGWQHEVFSDGLRSAEDALRLYAYAEKHPELPEMAEEWTPAQLRAAIGYNPLGRGRRQWSRDKSAALLRIAPRKAA